MAESSKMTTKKVSSTYKSTGGSTGYSTKTTSSTMTYKSSSQKTVTSSDMGSGMNVDTEMDRMRLKLDDQMGKMKEEMFKLMPLEAPGTPHQIIKMDDQSLQKYIDDAHKDKVRFNFDIHDFSTESVVVKSDGNKIEVHAKKTVKKGDDEQSEEYSRTYELPKSVDAQHFTSAIQKDANILTIELPMSPH